MYVIFSLSKIPLGHLHKASSWPHILQTALPFHQLPVILVAYRAHSVPKTTHIISTRCFVQSFLCNPEPSSETMFYNRQFWAASRTNDIIVLHNYCKTPILRYKHISCPYTQVPSHLDHHPDQKLNENLYFPSMFPNCGTNTVSLKFIWT